MKLQVIVGSTRPGRNGMAVASWVAEHPVTRSLFEVELVDLAAIGLPMLDEPAHPRMAQYVHSHTQAWSALVDSADAYVFVAPEYNQAPPAPLINALDCLYHEWAAKPAGIVTYGAASGGVRAGAILRQVLGALAMHPVNDSVAVPSILDRLDVTGGFVSTPVLEAAIERMLRGVARLGEALAPLRAGSL